MSAYFNNGLQVGTKYDPKEEIFRNYPGFVGPNNLVMSLCYVWRSGAECHVTVLWVDPSGATVHRRDHQIGSKRSAGVYTLELKSPFQPGIWQVILQSELETLVELKFLVLPIATVIEIPLNEDDDNPGPSVNKSLNAKQVKFNAANKVKLTDNAKMSDKTFERDLLSWIDELTAQFWNAESICTLEDLGQDGPNIPLCSETTWSSMSPDPKSEIKLDGIGNIIK